RVGFARAAAVEAQAQAYPGLGGLADDLAAARAAGHGRSLLQAARPRTDRRPGGTRAHVKTRLAKCLEFDRFLLGLAKNSRGDHGRDRTWGWISPTSS